MIRRAPKSRGYAKPGPDGYIVVPGDGRAHWPTRTRAPIPRSGYLRRTTATPKQGENTMPQSTPTQSVSRIVVHRPGDSDSPPWELDLHYTMPSGRLIVSDPGTNDRFLLTLDEGQEVLR